MRSLLLLPALLAAFFATEAHTAGGGGEAPISGYSVSDVHYTVAGDRIAAVAFTLSPASATRVRARLGLAEPWADCAVRSGSVTCAVSTSVAEASALAVLATG